MEELIEFPQKLLDDTLEGNDYVNMRESQSRKRKVAVKATNVEVSTKHNQNSINQMLANYMKSEEFIEEMDPYHYPKLTRVEAKELSFEPSVDVLLTTHHAQPEILIKDEVPEDDSLLVENVPDSVTTGLGRENIKKEDHPMSVEYQDSSDTEWNVDVTTAPITSDVDNGVDYLKKFDHQPVTEAEKDENYKIGKVKTESVKLEFEMNGDIEISEIFKMEPVDSGDDNETSSTNDENEENLFKSGLKYSEYETEVMKNIDELVFENKLINCDNEINEIKKEEDYKAESIRQMVDVYCENIIVKIKNEHADEIDNELVDKDRDEDFVEREGAENLKYEEVEVLKHEVFEDDVEEGCNTVEVNDVEPILINIEQIPILQQQMIQHVQMLTQNFILTYKHPELHQSSCHMKEYLLNLKFLCEGKERSMFHTINLSTSLELVDHWEKLLATNNDDVKKMKLHIEETIAKSIRGHQVGSGYIVTFPTLILETISSSTAFVYPSLLPKIPFKTPKIAVKQCVYYTKSEDHLISLGLEQFMPLVDGEKKCSDKKWSRKNGLAVCRYIQEHMLPHREATKIVYHVNFVRHKRPRCNPIRYYLDLGHAPPYDHHVIPLGQLLPPNKRSLQELPYQWQEFVKSRQDANEKINSNSHIFVLMVH